MVKKILVSIILCFFVLVGIIVPSGNVSANQKVTTSALGFSDISSDYTFADDITYLTSKGVISGYNDGTFRPNEVVNRAQAIIMIGRALGWDGTPRDTKYKDVTSNVTGSGYIASASEKGILELLILKNNLGNNFYSPYSSLTRGDMAILVDRSYQLKNSHTNPFDDITNIKSYQSILNIYNAEITYGYHGGKYYPNLYVTRGQFSAFLNRAMQKFPNGFDNRQIEEPKIEKPKVKNGKELETYLKSNYSKIDTNLTKVPFNISVSENDSKYIDYDYKINLGMDSYAFENVLNARLSSIKDADTAQKDVELARKQVNDFIEKMARDIIAKMPDKKFLGQNRQTTYGYPNLKMDGFTSITYSWLNYEPISMENEWPGDEPNDFYEIKYGWAFDRDNYDEEKAKKYEEDDSKRTSYMIEYSSLEYNDFKITDFHWAKFLDEAYSIK